MGKKESSLWRYRQDPAIGYMDDEDMSEGM